MDAGRAELAEILIWLKVISGLLVGWIAVVVVLAISASRRLGRVENWQLHHGEPLERLRLEQDAAEDPARAAAIRNPHRGGSREVPL